MLGTRNRQRTRLRPCRYHDMLRLQEAVVNADRIPPREEGLALDDLHVATSHRPSKVRRDILDQVLLALDQSGPVELRFSDRDMMNGRALDLMQGMPGSNQNLLRRAAAVRARSAEIVRFDHRDRHSSTSYGAGNAHAGVAATKDHHIECLWCHGSYPRPNCFDAIATQCGPKACAAP